MVSSRPPSSGSEVCGWLKTTAARRGIGVKPTPRNARPLGMKWLSHSSVSRLSASLPQPKQLPWLWSEGCSITPYSSLVPRGRWVTWLRRWARAATVEAMVRPRSRATTSELKLKMTRRSWCR